MRRRRRDAFSLVEMCLVMATIGYILLVVGIVSPLTRVL